MLDLVSHMCQCFLCPDGWMVFRSGWITCSLHISSADGHLCCFHLGVREKGKNAFTYISLLWIFVFTLLYGHIFISLGSVPKSSGIVSPTVTHFEESPNCFPNWLNHFPPYRQWMRTLISPCPGYHLLVCLFDYSRPSRWEVASHCGFDFTSQMAGELSIFLCAYWPFIYLLWWTVNT